MARKQEEFQVLSFIDIFKESLNLIFSCPKIFVQIALLLALPPSLVSLATYVELSPSLPNKLFPITSYGSLIGSPSSYNKVPDATSSKMDVYPVILLAFTSFLQLIFQILRVSTVVYTVTCIQTGKEITFRKAISVVPKVWKSLTWTYLSIFCMYFVIFAVFLFVMITGGVLMMTYYYNSSKAFGALVGISIGIFIVSALFTVGIIYLSIIWLLADVVSVIEKNSGLKALKKSKSLIKGKMGTAVAAYLVLFLCSFPSLVVLQKLKNSDVKIGEKVFCGILMLVWSTMLSILILVVKTVLYMVCKSYHHEPIDKVPFVDYNEVSLGDHLPLKMKEEQVEDLQV